MARAYAARLARMQYAARLAAWAEARTAHIQTYGYGR